MITLSLIWSNVKIFAAIVLVIGIVWIYKDKEFYRAENVRQSENVSWLRKYDSLRFSNQVLSSKEIEEHITYNDPELKKKLEAANIKINRIESLVSQTLKYRDTSKRETDISGLIDAIKNSIPKQQSWIDTTECMIVKGIALFDGQKLKVAVTDRQFNNKSDGVVYWQRRQWKFLGIKTRLLGKKEFTSTNFDECGESRIMKIEKKK